LSAISTDMATIDEASMVTICESGSWGFIAHDGPITLRIGSMAR
jgi:hypothetical protein